MNNNGTSILIKKSKWSIRKCNSAGSVFKSRHTIVVGYKIWQITHVERVIRVWIRHPIRTGIQVPPCSTKGRFTGAVLMYVTAMDRAWL